MYEKFREDVLRGLSLDQKAIPARWFYDRRGSELFERITQLPEYYPSRVETLLLKEYGAAIARLVGGKRVVVEFGAGSATKTPWLLRAIEPAAYVALDISGPFLHESAQQLARLFPKLSITPLEADFMQPLHALQPWTQQRTLGFFPGSTIGNLTAPSAVALLERMRTALGSGAMLLIGVDRIKPVETLLAAYDDAAGITAAFNANLLQRVNEELHADIPVASFRHRVRWCDEEARIEMHLEAECDVAFGVAGRRFGLRSGETIHTENSYKYARRDANLLLRSAGWSPLAEWTDPEDQFAMLLAEARCPLFAP